MGKCQKKFACQKLLQVFVVGDDPIMNNNEFCNDITSGQEIKYICRAILFFIIVVLKHCCSLWTNLINYTKSHWQYESHTREKSSSTFAVFLLLFTEINVKTQGQMIKVHLLVITKCTFNNSFTDRKLC